MKAGYHEETDSEDEVVESKEKDVKKDVEEEEVEKNLKPDACKDKKIKGGHCEETDSEIDVKDDIDALVGDATYLKNLNKGKLSLSCNYF